MPKEFIGTSGWNYPHWKKIFYPENLSEQKWLKFYAKYFNCVELNVTFYRLVKKKTFESWRKNTPKKFYFVAKGSRFITHIKKLKDINEPLGLFLKNTNGLKEKLVAILWQFPPNFKINLERLKDFLKLLAKKSKIRQAFEFRNETWFSDKVYAILKKYNACLCMAYSDRFPLTEEATADFLYLRFHGSDALYASNYSDKELKKIVRFAKKFSKKQIFAFFNNDARGYAVKNAIRFKKLVNE